MRVEASCGGAKVGVPRAKVLASKWLSHGNKSHSVRQVAHADRGRNTTITIVLVDNGMNFYTPSIPYHGIIPSRVVY